MKKSETWIIETRREAAAAGRSKYWTGRKCGRDHESRRYTSSGVCCKCNAENVKAYKKKINDELRGLDDPRIAVEVKIHFRQVKALRDYVEILNNMEGVTR